MTLDLNKVIYTKYVIDDHKCSVSYYEGKSYINIYGVGSMSTVKAGHVNEQYLKELILDLLSENLKHDMHIR